LSGCANALGSFGRRERASFVGVAAHWDTIPAGSAPSRAGSGHSIDRTTHFRTSTEVAVVVRFKMREPERRYCAEGRRTISSSCGLGKSPGT
jgi:hypothetical protein